MQIEQWPIDRLVFYGRNPRKNDAVVDRMVGSIREFGFKVPVLARSDGEVVDGHLRLKAARKLGLTDIPVILCDEWTPAQVKAFRLLVNRSVTWADWDEELLGLELLDLKSLDFDLALTGFDGREIDDLLLGAGTTDPREEIAPDPPENPVSKPGDLWCCGPHRVLCGDSTVADATARLFGGVSPHLMVTDPPYGVSYSPEWRAEAGVNRNRGKMGAVSNDERADWHDAWVLFPGTVVYVWHAGRHTSTVQQSLERAQFEIVSQIIWAKDRFALSRGDYHWHHEPCWYAVKAGSKHHWTGARDQSTLWQIPRADDKGHGHGTQKPVECMRRPIVNNSSPGQTVYDAFLGSGTTMIAAETTGRVCYGMELDPKYVDVIVKRWQEFVGKKATLEGEGRTFEKIANERLGCKT